MDESTLNAVADALKTEASAPTTSTFVTFNLAVPWFEIFRVFVTDLDTPVLPMFRELAADMSATPDDVLLMVTLSDRLADTFPAASLAQAYSVLAPAVANV